MSDINISVVLLQGSTLSHIEATITGLNTTEYVVYNFCIYRLLMFLFIWSSQSRILAEIFSPPSLPLGYVSLSGEGI